MDAPEFLEPYMPWIHNILIAIVIFVFGWIASKWANWVVLKSCRKKEVDEALARFLGSIAQYAVLAAAIIASLAAVGVQTTSLVAIFASAGLAVGLALQGSLSNFASGVLILFHRPFTLEDKVTIAGETGKVIDIGLFATTVLTLDNQRIIVPNKSVTDNPITNFTVEGTLRVGIDVGVAYGSDIEKVREILLNAANTIDYALEDPAPSAAFLNMGASSLDFKVFIWCATADFGKLLHDGRQAVYDALNKEGIDIPFNQIVVHQAG
jgi:small conductance mechanosensitive channel